MFCCSAAYLSRFSIKKINKTAKISQFSRAAQITGADYYPLLPLSPAPSGSQK